MPTCLADQLTIDDALQQAVAHHNSSNLMEAERLYRGILGAIEANGYDVFTKRAHVPVRSKILTALTAAIAG